MEEEDSILQYYRKLIQLRKEYDVISKGSYEPLLETHPQVFAYKRNYENENLIVVNNFYGEETTIDLAFEGYKVLISNYAQKENEDPKKLHPYETRVYYKK